MKLKLCVLVLSLTSISFAEGASRNLCDDLIDSGTSSAEQIKKCLDDPRFGPSSHYKEEETKNKKKEEITKLKDEDTDKVKVNFEIKKFTSDELFDAGFGKAFYAIRGDYRNHRYKEKRITEGDALCTYLGYEKAIKSTVSPELWENKDGSIKVDKQGLVVDTDFMGNVSKTPEIYHDEDFKFTVRKYVEITCIKRKDKSVDGSKDALKAVTEDLVMLNGELNASSSNGGNRSSGVNDKPRTTSAKEGKTPNGYTQPDWAKDAQAR